jgi:hypothetical protein
MRKEQIENLIDKKIENYFSTGSTTFNVVDSLRESSKNIVKVLERDGFSFEDAQKMEWDKIDKVRVKYAVHYVKHSTKRISDMDWIRKKHGILSISNYVIWKHLKFREFLLNSKPILPEISKYFDKQRSTTTVLTKESIDNLTEKNWSSGNTKKPGQVVLRAFIKVVNEYNSYSKMISLPEEELELYEIDEVENSKNTYSIFPSIKLKV